MIEVGDSVIALGNAPVGLRIPAVEAIKAHAQKRAVAYANRDGEVRPAAANALEVFLNLATITGFALRLGIALVSMVIYPLTAVLNAKVALETPATGMASANLMVRASVILHSGGAHVMSNALEQMAKQMDLFAWEEDFAMRKVNVNALVFMLVMIALSSLPGLF